MCGSYRYATASLAATLSPLPSRHVPTPALLSPTGKRGARRGRRGGGGGRVCVIFRRITRRGRVGTLASIYGGWEGRPAPGYIRSDRVEYLALLCPPVHISALPPLLSLPPVLPSPSPLPLLLPLDPSSALSAPFAARAAPFCDRGAFLSRLELASISFGAARRIVELLFSLDVSGTVYRPFGRS